MLGLGLGLQRNNKKRSVLVTNIIPNGNFNDTTNLNITGTCTIDTSTYKYSPSSLNVTATGIATYTNINFNNVVGTAGHKYYIGLWYKKNSGTGALCAVLPYGFVAGAYGTPLTTADFDASATGTWIYKSGIYTTSSDGITVLFGRNNTATFNANYDGAVVIDITALGLSVEPTQAQLDALVTSTGTYFTSGYLAI